MSLPRLMVAPNGGRRGKADHPALPVTLTEILDCARACRAAGADGLHLHLRDDTGRHVLDAARYRAALSELNAAVPDMRIQVTTEAVDRYGPGHQRHVALTSGAAMVSVSIREICRDTPDARVAAFFERCAEAGIAVQHILYDTDDTALLARVLPPAQMADPGLQLLFVLGRYSETQDSAPVDLDPFLHDIAARGLAPDWAVCAFGRGETACLRHAIERGGKVRVGFENSVWREDGTRARDNAQRVADIRRLMEG
ncbi:BKACE family enzyme [Roseovarius salinarum]|uniref:3-keto-5-aminohexanoate cleavage protein n=1 Tax=Roseovarius salinarum TaxID=1981892 RepID=UPI001E3C8D05|nr:3-keto-5-aminohexanoate cleavage protein [Roseovarius salinarum]